MTENSTGQEDTSTGQSGGTALHTADLATPKNQPGSTVDTEQNGAGDTATQVETRPTGETERQAERTPLFAEEEASDFRTRWTDIQAGFVDEPRQAVEQADALVAEVMQRLAQTFAEERSNLEGQWQQGDDISTEDLRVSLQRYRSFFDRLLAV